MFFSALLRMYPVLFDIRNQRITRCGRQIIRRYRGKPGEARNEEEIGERLQISQWIWMLLHCRQNQDFYRSNIADP